MTFFDYLQLLGGFILALGYTDHTNYHNAFLQGPESENIPCNGAWNRIDGGLCDKSCAE